MSNEASIIELFNGGRPVRYNVADATSLEKGAIIAIYTNNDRLALVSTNADYPLVGILAEEKVTDDGQVCITVYTDGIFNCVVSAGARNAGVVYAASDDTNILQTADGADFLQGSHLGYALEDTAGSEAIAIRVNK